MIKQKWDIIKLICASAMIVLFLHLIKYHIKLPDTGNNSLSCSINSNLNLLDSKAIVIDMAQLPAVKKIYNHLPSNNFSEKLQISNDNKRIAQSYIVLQKTKPSLKPFIVQRFYHPLFSPDDDDWLILS